MQVHSEHLKSSPFPPRAAAGATGCRYGDQIASRASLLTFLELADLAVGAGDSARNAFLLSDRLRQSPALRLGSNLETDTDDMNHRVSATHDLHHILCGFSLDSIGEIGVISICGSGAARAAPFV